MNLPQLIPFDEKKEIEIQCDASQNGLGCCLLQDNKPISFASRSLSDNEKNYAQIEKEFLSILFACSKFKYFVYGRPITVVNDHKPLLGIINKEIHKIPSSKLQKIRLKLLNFDIRLKYAPGKTINIADYLSRYSSEENDEDKTITESVLSINVSDSRKNEFQKETEKDMHLSIIKKYCIIGWPKNKTKCKKEIRFYFKMRNEIILEDEILFYQERIMVPLTMRSEILKRLHESHFGIAKTRKRARDTVYWPGIDKDIEEMIGKCSICLHLAHKNQKEPLISHYIPNRPFEKIACDIFDFKGNYYTVLFQKT